MESNLENDFDLECPNLPDNRVSFLKKFERTNEGLKKLIETIGGAITTTGYMRYKTYESRLKGVDVDERS